MKRVALFVIPVLLGAAILVFLDRSQQSPEQAVVEERVYPVRVIKIPLVDLVPKIQAYGSVAPGKVWQAAAEVSGKITYVHPRLEAGEFLPAGVEILRIDSTDYELAVSQIEADIEATRAQLVENDVRERNARDSLAIERDSLTLSESEFERRRTLAVQGAFAESSVDEQARTVLAQRQSVVAQENTLRLLPAERQVLEAQLSRHRSQLKAARRDLARTAFTLPFNARIAVVNVEESESVRTGDVLVEADDISVAQIQAEVPLQQMRNTIITNSQSLSDLERFETRKLLSQVQTRVRLAEFDIQWQAQAVRLSPNLDPQTRTVGVVVEVKDHYKNAIPGVRPPLIKDMFVEVQFWGITQADRIVIPRTAVHEGRVYVVSDEGRLERREIVLGLVQPEFVSVEEGLASGELLVISDLVPAIEGMLLDPISDENALRRLITLAESRPQ